MKRWSASWKSSKKPNKQRKYVYGAPLHIKSQFLGSHLAPELRKKHGTRSMRIRKGDTVKIMSGSFRGKTGKVERINVKYAQVFITGIETVKKDGSKTLYPIVPSKLMIQELNMSDKKRIKRTK